MSTKRKGIELIQDRLAGAGAEADIRKRYPYRVVEALISRVYRDVSLKSQPWLNDMAMEYSYDVEGCDVVLSPKPVGSHGVIWVESAGVMYPVDQGGMESKILSIVEPGRIPGCRLINGKTLRFDKKICGKVCVMMIASFDDLQDDDEWIMPGADSTIYEMVVQLLRMTDQRPEENYNDGRDDFMRVQPKQERVK